MIRFIVSLLQSVLRVHVVETKSFFLCCFFSALSKGVAGTLWMNHGNCITVLDVG